MNRSRVALALAGLVGTSASVYAQSTAAPSFRDVYWGDQTWEEMQFTAFTFSMDSTPAKTASGGAKQ